MTIALLFAIALLLLALVGGIKEACEELARIRSATELAAINGREGLAHLRRLHSLANSAASERAR